MDNKCLWFVIICLVAAGVYFIFFGFGDSPAPVDLTKYNKLEEKLKLNQLQYQENIKKLQANQDLLINHIDSLDSVKSKTKVVYIEKIQVIDNISSIDLSNDFKRIFAKNNIE